MDWKTVSEKIVQDDQNKWDRKVSGQELARVCHASESPG
jgi:hypothetical protein